MKFWPEQGGADFPLNPTYGEHALMMTGQPLGLWDGDWS